jgi:competence protein ComEC
VANVTGSVLLTGDIERRVERALIQRYGDELSSSLLVAAHHGSAGSTSADFLAAVEPRVVLFSAGHLNRFGFPSEGVRQRVMARGSAMYATASSGAISYRFSRDGRMQGPVRHRRESARYWTHRPTPRGRP